MIALFLALMSKLSTNNWMAANNINALPWIEQYVGSYYWAINIMLTVGVGNISATNTNEALCLIFIQILSCVVIAYNVAAIGTIIKNIRADDLKKSKKYKQFKKIMDSNSLSESL